MLMLRHPVSLLVIVMIVMIGVLRTFSTPDPVGADAPDVVFSAHRAEAILRDLLAENVSHPVGSEENARVRDRIMEHLSAAGYQPEIQSRFHCNPLFGACARIENILAVKPGSEGKSAVLLTAHYDSGWAGAGAADDGSGVAAVLEIARMAADFPPFKNDVVFLLTDGEESGLIGAHAFAEHHELFEKVKAVINLEARGVTGPSVMFETGAGNRSVIRMLSKAVDRPVANSLTYEIYKTLPNDTDYSVYKRRDVMGVNFAFAGGVAVYHSQIDDIDHLDLGSLQHHGDNAWGMLNALGERDLARITHREDAAYVDLFAGRLSHYPLSIAGGLALFFGVWTMLAIGLAFRHEFRFRQLRWGLLAVPATLAAIGLGGYLLSWPLGHWPDLHPLEHPAPWVGRITLMLMVVLAGYSSLRLFSGRVSACAWMIIAWALIFFMALVSTARFPAGSYIAVLPLAMFSLGSVVDLFRKKSPAPLLFASILGFGTATFIALYHFFLLDAVFNFDRSGIRVIPLWLIALTAMPMLLAAVKRLELSWQPARWLLVAVLSGCFIHLFIPGYTADRPRPMTLLYTEVEGSSEAHIVLESRWGQHDRKFAAGHAFSPIMLNAGNLKRSERPARPIEPIGLPALMVRETAAEATDSGWRRRFDISLPFATPVLRLTLPLESGLEKAWINGVLALDTSLPSKRPRQAYRLGMVHPESGTVTLELDFDRNESLMLAAVTWHELPGVLSAPFLGNWPDDAQPMPYRPRAEKIQEFTLEPVTQNLPGAGQPSVPISDQN